MNKLQIKLAGLLLLCISFLAGCVIVPKSYNGFYEIACNPSEARGHAAKFAEILAQKLSRTAMVVDDGSAGIQIIIKDNRNVNPAQAISIVVTYDNAQKYYSVTLRKRELGEDAQVRLIKERIEDFLNAQGAKWTFEISDSSMAG